MLLSRLRHLFICTALLAGLAAPGVWAAQDFASTVRLGGVTLVKNGHGTRYRALFQVYELALYLERKTEDPQQVLDMPGPKKISFVARRNIPTDQFGLMMISGISANVSGARASVLLNHMNEIVAVFTTHKEIREGQRFSVNYVPGEGTTMYLDGQQKGPTVSDPLFAEAILSIWMGPKPVDPQLKDVLLGKFPTVPDSTHIN